MKHFKNKRMALRIGIAIAAMFSFISTAAAQNVTGYDSMPDPILFLLREPAVQHDLGLTDEQQMKLVEFNDTWDTAMLGSRNKRDQEFVQQQAKEITEETRELIGDLFTSEQLDRLRQIRYRLRGMSFVLLPEAAFELGLTDEQIEEIQSAVDDAREKINKVSSREFQGKEAERESQKTIVAARKEEQKKILSVLDKSQKKKFITLVGDQFDADTLGRASFKAPSLIDSGEWVNTESLKLSSMKGKVVALHFFAFG